MKRLGIVPIAVSLLMLVGAAPAQAGALTEVSILACHNDGGEVTVPRGSELWLEMYWGSRTRRQANQFVNRVKTIAKIDGVAVTESRTYWLEPIPHESGDWEWTVSWSYPAGQLRRGESMTVTVQWKLLRGVSDGVSWYAEGPIFDPRLKCVLTAA